MNRASLGLFLGLAAAAFPAAAAAGEPAKPSAEAAALARRIDAVLEAAWAEQKIKPAAAADDSEFLRRVYLDLAGRIPTVTEARTFHADKSSDRRTRLVAQLLQRPTFARHMTHVWRHLLLPEADANQQLSFIAPGFESWLRQQFARNAGYDRLVRELLTAPMNQSNPQFFDVDTFGKPSPVPFYVAKESKPENLASATARVFLGLRLECAQCHNHPFATWTRDQFWGLSAFFAGLRAINDQGDGIVMPAKEILDRRELAIPGTERIVQATFPDGAEPEWKYKVGPRQTLAEWVTAKDNPYFARAAVNRVWSLMFGIGLVEPVDEMAGGHDITVHSQPLLDELAKAFVAHNYDLRFLFEAIAGSKAYQLSSRGKGPAPLFSRQLLRGLSAEQLYDSLAVATGQPNFEGENPFGRFNGDSRAEFLTKFAQQGGKPTDHETSIIQALTLMNGSFVSEAANPTRSELLGAIIEAPFFTEHGRIETVYLATLSRFPTAKELEKAESFIGRATTGDGSKKPRTEALADVFWALLNSAEFGFNH